MVDDDEGAGVEVEVEGEDVSDEKALINLV